MSRSYATPAPVRRLSSTRSSHLTRAFAGGTGMGHVWDNDGVKGARVGILGPLEVRDAAGKPVPLAGPRLRALRVRLAVAGAGGTWSRPPG